MLTIKLNENTTSGMLYAIADCEYPDIYSEEFWGWDTESDVGYELMEFGSLIQNADVFDSLEAAEDRADDVLSSIFENEVFIVGLDPYTPHNLTGFVKKIIRDSINESKSIKEFNESSNNYKNYLDLVFKPGNILKLKRMFEFFDGGVSTLDDIDKAVIDAASKFVSYDYSYTDTRVKIIFPTGTEFEAIKLEKVEDKWYDYLIWLKEVSTGALVPIVFDEGEDPRDLFSGIPEYKLDNKSDEIDIEEVEDDLYFRGMRHDFGDYEDTAAYEMTDRAEDIFGMDHDTAYDLAWKVVSRMKDNGFEFEEGEEDDFLNESKSIKESSLVDKKVSTLGKRGKPMYFTAAQLKDAKAKYPEYDFEEATIDKSLPQGQKAYIAKKKTNESKSIKESATGDYVEVAYICDGFTNFRVYGGGFKTSDALVTVEDEKGKRLRLTMGDVCEFYTWYDAKGNVIHEPTYYSED